MESTLFDVARITGGLVILGGILCYVARARKKRQEQKKRFDIEVGAEIKRFKKYQTKEDIASLR